jgi:prepilin-type N-terminal cleavage/methylation domain-containing protein
MMTGEMNMKGKARLGFTLIELLIVVAIIAILAAIAVPNFLEAQTRAKVSRAKADMRTLVLGIESYIVDNNKPMPDYGGSEWKSWILVTTPISYISAMAFSVFNLSEEEMQVNAWKRSMYEPFGQMLYPYSANPADLWFQFPDPASAGTKGMGQYGYLGRMYYIVSPGPDNDLLQDQNWNWPDFPEMTKLYDPTNGTTSNGNIVRTNKKPEGN